MAQQHPPLHIDAAEHADAYVVHIRGELDLAACPCLELALLEAEHSQAEQIFLDLEGLTFADASGLNTLLKASHRSSSNGGRLKMTRGTGQVAKMFHLTALDVALPFTEWMPDENSARKTAQTTIPNEVMVDFAAGAERMPSLREPI